MSTTNWKLAVYPSQPVTIQVKVASGFKNFYIHEELLLHYSTYYGGASRDRASARNSDNSEVLKPWGDDEIDEHALVCLIDWLYSNTLPFYECPPDDVNFWLHNREKLIRIYALADLLYLIPLQNAIVKSCHLYYSNFTRNVQHSHYEAAYQQDWRINFQTDLRVVDSTGSTVWKLGQLIIKLAAYHVLGGHLQRPATYLNLVDSALPAWAKVDNQSTQLELADLYKQWWEQCKHSRPSWSQAHERHDRACNHLLKELVLEKYLEEDVLAEAASNTRDH